MKNNLFCPIFQCNDITDLIQEDIKENLLNDKTSNLFRYSLLKSNPTQIIFSYNLMLIQILRVGFTFSELDTGKRTVKVRIRFSNILILVYVLQLAIGFACLIAAALYLNNSVLKAFFICLPILIYIVIMVNFKFFKTFALKKFRAAGIIIDEN